MVDDDLEVLRGRVDWSVEGRLATYQRPEGGWCGEVRRAVVATRAAERFHVAIISPAGVAVAVRKASTVGGARRLVEVTINAKA